MSRSELRHIYPINISDLKPTTPSTGEPILTDTELHQHEELVVHNGGATIRRWADRRPYVGEKAIDQYVRERETNP